jgi:hypothetical protein
MGNLRKSGVYFDTRETPWYTTVKDTRARYWTEPFLGAVERLLGVALSVPVFNKDGSLAGVCNVRLIFTALSDWMNSFRLGDNGRAFIIDATGHLIAASGGVSPVAIGTDGKHQRLPPFLARSKGLLDHIRKCGVFSSRRDAGITELPLSGRLVPPFVLAFSSERVETSNTSPGAPARQHRSAQPRAAVWRGVVDPRSEQAHVRRRGGSQSV